MLFQHLYNSLFLVAIKVFILPQNMIYAVSLNPGIYD